MITRILTGAMPLLILCLLLTPTYAHMEMKWPYPFRSKFNPETPSSQIDYSMTSPLTSNPLNFPCKGYQNDTLSDVTMYNAGSTYNMTLSGSANHGGGSCQLSVSYDQGKTFKVIKSIIGGCGLEWTYNFTIPTYAPTGHALFAWTWSNYMGNREFYMNCAPVHIMSTSSTSSLQFDDLPNVWVADLSTVNSCNTDGPNGSETPVYPDPGPDVQYGEGFSSSSPATPGDCEVPLISRQVAAPQFQFDPVDATTTSDGLMLMATTDSSMTMAMTDSLIAVEPTTSDSSIVIATITSDSSMVMTMTTSEASTMMPATTSQSSMLMPTTLATSTSFSMLASTTFPSSASTTTLTVDCPSVITITLPPTIIAASYTISAPSSVCTGTSALCPCANGYACMAVGTCTWECMAMSMTVISSFQTSVLPTTASQVSADLIVSSSLPAPSNAASQVSLNYVPASMLKAYLPCMPGTFICTDPNTWYTCNIESDGSWDYQYPRTVAAGMQCQPHISPGGSSTAQQPYTPDGYYRDDQYVRAPSR